MIATKPVEIVLEKIIDKMKDINQIYVTLSLYESIYIMNKKNDDCPLSLMTVATSVAVAVESQFRIR